MPNAQGLSYAFALRRQGTVVRVLEYPEDNHALDKVETTADVMCNTISWIIKYM